MEKKQSNFLLDYSKEFLLSRPLCERKRILTQLFLRKDQEELLLSHFYSLKHNEKIKNVPSELNREADKIEIKEKAERQTTYLNKNMNQSLSNVKTRSTAMPINKTLQISKIMYDESLQVEEKDKKIDKTPSFLDNIIDPFSADNLCIYKGDYFNIGCLESLKYLLCFKNSSKYGFAINELKEKFEINSWRRVSGDGDCFFRAIILNYLEILILESISNKTIQYLLSFIIDIYYTSFPIEHEDILS